MCRIDEVDSHDNGLHLPVRFMRTCTATSRMDTKNYCTSVHLAYFEQRTTGTPHFCRTLVCTRILEVDHDLPRVVDQNSPLDRTWRSKSPLQLELVGHFHVDEQRKVVLGGMQCNSAFLTVGRSSTDQFWSSHCNDEALGSHLQRRVVGGISK